MHDIVFKFMMLQRLYTSYAIRKVFNVRSCKKKTKKKNKRAMMALYCSPELLWTAQKCSWESVNKILLRFDLVTYFWTQSHPLSRQTFWYSFIKIEAKLWPLEGEQDLTQSDLVTQFFYPTWPIFELDQDIIKTNTLIKVHENWNKSMASRGWTWF